MQGQAYTGLSAAQEQAQKNAREARVEELKKRAKDRETPLYMGELIEILLLHGKSFEDIKKMTLQDFEACLEPMLE